MQIGAAANLIGANLSNANLSDVNLSGADLRGANLSGAFRDDGLPDPRVTVAWSITSGPGTVTFGDPNATDTRANFSRKGTYVLRLTARDSALSDFDDVTIVVTRH